MEVTDAIVDDINKRLNMLLPKAALRASEKDGGVLLTQTSTGKTDFYKPGEAMVLYIFLRAMSGVGVKALISAVLNRTSG